MMNDVSILKNKLKPKPKNIRWYPEIKKDLSLVIDAANFYKDIIEESAKHTVAIGNLETLVAETPGLLHYYKSIHTDAQQIRKWLEEKYELESAKKYKWFLRSPEAKQEYGELKTTEISKLVKADDNIFEYYDKMSLMSYYENLLDDICIGLQNRSIMLSHLVNIRKEGLQEVWINPTQETNNQ